MGFFSKIFSKGEGKETTTESNATNEESRKLIEIGRFLEEITSADHFVARSEYAHKITDYKSVIEYFGVLRNSGMLKNYCAKNKMDVSSVESTLATYGNITHIVDEKNDEYVNRAMHDEKDYLDTILAEVDPKIMLDEDQRRVVLTDEDYCLVVAGAGAGKTTTVAAKVKYLVEKKNVKPNQILVVSFTNKAVKELRDKLNNDLKIECPIGTFHATGNTILRKNNPEKMNIVDDYRLYYLLIDYFKDSVLKNESMTNNLIRFFASYFDAPYEGTDLNAFFNKIAKSNFTTMRSDLENFKEEVMENRTKKMISIQSEVLRSYEEVEIANFLYLNNIDYKYEPIYPYNFKNAKRPYTPDFVIKQGDKTIYLEHFGITENGTNNRYSEAELADYKQAIKDKIALHKQHGTTVIYTFSEYNDHKSIEDHLKEKLESLGIEMRPRPQKEIMEKLVSTEESRYIRRLILLICRFISNFKINGYTEEEFNRMYHSTQNVRTRLFLDICNECYLQYQRYLKEHNAVDFQDMINESARLLKEVKELGQKLDFKYIIVDEYQDISRQRFDLVTALSEVTDAKIIAVGDDWQSIYAFSGSDITLFTKFEEKMGYARLLKIENTYRNSQEVIDIAGSFIQRNETQIRKTLRSPKHIDKPVIIYTYDPKLKGNSTNWRSGVNYALAAATEKALDQITEYNRTENRNSKKILVLGRFGFDGDQLDKSGLFEYNKKQDKLKSVKHPELDLTFMTAHASKGLGYDEVIVINGKNETYGFPSKIEDDPILALVVKEDRSIEYAEERRLFYVAMTRTKNRVYFVAPEKNPSEFLLELKQVFSTVELVGKWNEEPPQRVGKRVCPVCGYPMQLKFHRSYGLRLYICTNEPEICGFMTNEPKAGKLSIMKCDECHDGYLVVKPGKDNTYFLGCTNYLPNGQGCNRVIAKKYYYEMMKYEPEAETVTESKNDKKTFNGETAGKEPANVQKQQEPAKESNLPGLNLSASDIEMVGSEVMYEGHDLKEVLTVILQTMVEISKVRFYGVYVLNEVLHGSTSDKVMKAGLNEMEWYGKLSWMDLNATSKAI